MSYLYFNALFSILLSYKFLCSHLFYFLRLIEEEAKQSGRAKFSILVDEWGSSGKNRPKIYDLINLLHQVELFQAVCLYIHLSYV